MTRDQREGASHTVIQRPKRGNPPVLCRWCGEELEAWALLTVHGLAAGYLWQHINTSSRFCEPSTPPEAEPYDHWDAEHKIRAANRV